jgi:hypothetical protein
MGLLRGPGIVTEGLDLSLDPASVRSYPGSGTNWNDLTRKLTYTIGSNLTFNPGHHGGSFTMSNNGGAGGGALSTTTLTTSTTCTFVIWIKTTDSQALFWGATPSSYGGSYYLGAFRSGNKEYYGNCGSPDYYQDLVEVSNIYDNVRDGEWHMCEFKNVNFSSWTNQHNFNSYSTYTFGNGSCGPILIYNRNLSSSESLQNYNAFKQRFLG